MDMVVRVSAGEGGQSGLMRRSAQSSSAPFYFRPPETHNVLEREHFQYFFSKGDVDGDGVTETLERLQRPPPKSTQLF